MKAELKTLIFLFIILISFSCSKKNNKKIGGVNLYTFRKELTKNPKKVLKLISEIGYKNIEDVGYADGKFYGMTPLEFKRYLKTINLHPIASHQGGITYNNANKIITDLKTIGCRYLVIPIPPMGYFTVDKNTHKLGMTCDAKTLANILNTLGEKCNKAGLKLLYHNHDFEFERDKNGVIPLDYLLENTNPDFVNFELDFYWVAKAKVNPITYFKKYPNRFKTWHLKDMDNLGRFAPVGDGSLNFASYLANKQLSGMEYYFIEQDLTYENMTPFEAITRSLQTIKNLGYN